MEAATRVELSRLRETGQLEERLRFAREVGNDKCDETLLKRAILKGRRKLLLQRGYTDNEIVGLLPTLPPGRVGMPTIGTVSIPVILIDFSDYEHVNSREDIEGRIFGEGNPANFPYETVTQYYERSSYGQLNLEGNVLPWYRVSRARTDIKFTAHERESLIKEAFDHLASEGHDFAQYDLEENGTIDYFIVLWAGSDTGWGSFWWGYQTSFTDDSYRINGKRLGKYSWQWESRPVGNPFNPRVVIHETGHALGLPDYYDYDDSLGPRGGVGGLDMMDANIMDHNCFSKWILDWIDPAVVASGTYNLNLRPSGIYPDAVLTLPGDSFDEWGEQFTEYYLIQNRVRIGNDAQGISEGLLIWHVDAHLDPSGRHFLYNNSYTNRKLLRLMEADGLEEIESGRAADAGDYYTPGQSFDSTTSPNSNKYDGSGSGISISEIARHGEVISARYSVERAEIKLIPSIIVFPATIVGHPMPYPLTIQNTGTVNLEISALPSTSSYFAWGVIETTIAPGHTYPLVVNFIPPYPGYFQGIVEIESNAHGSPHRIPLIGLATFR